MSVYRVGASMRNDRSKSGGYTDIFYRYCMNTFYISFGFNLKDFIEVDQPAV
jgi:hypothetical protein